MNIQFTPEAIDDLKRLKELIEAKNPVAVQRISLELRTGIDKLKLFPKMGLKVHLAPDPEIIRDLFIGDYTVRYLLGSSDLHILRIWHDNLA